MNKDSVSLSLLLGSLKVKSSNFKLKKRSFRCFSLLLNSQQVIFDLKSMFQLFFA